MYDINGKLLKVGDQFVTYRYGLCLVKELYAEGSSMLAMYGFLGGGVFSIDQETFSKEFREAIKVRTWKELAQEALQVQDASNLSGVATSFSQVVRECRARLESEGRGSSQELQTHPVIQMWADKIASLTHTQGAWNAIKAYNWAEEQTKG